MPQRYVNPFNPQTQIGASLQNIATAMFSGPTPSEVASREAQAEERRLHAHLYQQQARKAIAEAAAQEALNRARSPDAIDEAVAWGTRQPIAAIRTARDYLHGRSGQAGTMPPAGPVLDSIGDTMFALRTGLMDKSVNPHQIAQARGEYGNQRTREGIMAGTVDPTVAAQASYATSGKAPITFNRQGAGNVVTGDFAMNDIGRGDAEAARALAASRSALARSHDATAGYRSAQAQQVQSGMNHPLVPIEDFTEDGSPVTTWQTRQDARGRLASAAESPAMRESRLAQAQRALRPTGGAPRPQQVPSLQKHEMAALAETFGRLSGDAAIDPDVSAEITARAVQLATTPSSPFFRNPVGAANRVWGEVQGRLSRTNPWWGRPRVSFAAPQQVTSQAGVPSGPAAAAAVPAPGSRVKGQVYQTPRGPMTWTGTGWVPAI
jgi:hypothetical protein